VILALFREVVGACTEAALYTNDEIYSGCNIFGMFGGRFRSAHASIAFFINFHFCKHLWIILVGNVITNSIPEYDHTDMNNSYFCCPISKFSPTVYLAVCRRAFVEPRLLGTQRELPLAKAQSD